MVAIDANVLVRLLIDDDDAQSATARALLKAHAPVFISHVVLAETGWVLTSAYGFTRDKLGHLIEMPLDADGFVLQDPPVVQAALAAFQKSKADFSDCLIMRVAQKAGAGLLATFDDKVAKVPGTRRLGSKEPRRK
jgi:predicted nucleic-acid-binding protein